MIKMTICLGSSCFSRANSKNVEIAERFLKERGLKDDVDIDLAGSLCTGNCEEGPIVIVDGKVHKRVDSGAMLDLLNELFPNAATAGRA